MVQVLTGQSAKTSCHISHTVDWREKKYSEAGRTASASSIHAILYMLCVNFYSSELYRDEAYTWLLSVHVLVSEPDP